MTANTFKFIRTQLGWSINQLATAVGVSPRHIRRIEDGTRNCGTSLAVLMNKLAEENF